MFTFTLGVLRDIHYINGGISFNHFQTLLIAINALVFSCFISFVIDIYITKFRRTLAFFVSFASIFLLYYYAQSKTHISFDIIFNHTAHLTSLSGFSFATEYLKATFFAYHFFWSFLGAGLVVASYKFDNSFDLKIRKIFRQRNKIVIFVLFLLVLLAPKNQLHPISNFIRSTYSYFVQEKNLLSEIANSNGILKPILIESSFCQNTIKPNIYLIIVESLNSRFLNKIAKDNKYFTPFTNKLIDESFYVDKYYSNSVYTSKGHYAIFCNQLPSVKNTEFIFLKSDVSINCFPEILKKYAYKNYFYQADPNLNVGGQQSFLLSRGFDTVETLSLCKKNCEHTLLPDSAFYTSFFTKIEKLPLHSGGHLFALATIQSHMPFDFLNEDQAEIYKNPTSSFERYSNSIRLVDKSIEQFFNELKKRNLHQNAIVIVTGDHGFPLGEHNNDKNENFIFEENVRVPLIIKDFRTDLKKDFNLQQHNTFSHLNLGSTIIDLAGISTEYSGTGQSIFSTSKQGSSVVYLVQPHSGRYQAVVKWPYKYIFWELTSEEYIYNLEADPSELIPLDMNKLDQNIISGLRQEASYIWSQQYLYN